MKHQWRNKIISGRDGFTLVEVVAAWAVFMILLLGFGKGVTMASGFGAEGRRVARFSEEAYSYAENGKEAYREQKENVSFEMGGSSGTVRVRIREYKANDDFDQKEGSPKVLMKTVLIDWDS